MRQRLRNAEAHVPEKNAAGRGGKAATANVRCRHGDAGEEARYYCIAGNLSSTANVLLRAGAACRVIDATRVQNIVVYFSDAAAVCRSGI